MKIIVNAVGYVGQSGGAGGAGVFIQYLIGELARLHAVDVLVAPNSKNFHVRQRNARFIELPYLTAETLRHMKDGPTVVIDPFGAVPCLPFPEDLALCAVVHDLMHLERPHFFTESERQGRSESFAKGMQRADAVVVFSADQARATKHYFPGTAPTVIPHLPYAALVDHGLSAAADAGAEPFLLFPAVKWPHKNHRTVLAAFAAYVRLTGSKLRLRVCGGPCAENRFSYYPPDDSISPQVDDLGLISEVKLRALYASASAVLFPTLYEGFGIPVLEAAYLGRMVIASRLDVFDEILGRQAYRSVEDPLCQLRWMEAFAEVETARRAQYEAATIAIRSKVSQARYISQFSELLKSVAERYTHPGLYPMRAFRSGDRPTSAVIANLNFVDIHATAVIERGSRNAALGAKPATQSSWIFRSADAGGERRVCLRAQFKVDAANTGAGGQLLFSSWVRLLAEPLADALVWSVNDGSNVDLLPDLRDGEWHLVRRVVPAAGYIDFRASLDGISEVPAADLELHDPCIVCVDAMPIPESEPLAKGLDIFVADLSETSALGSTIAAVRQVNDALPSAGLRLRWNIVTTGAAAAGIPGTELPANARVQFVEAEAFTRTDAARLITPYQAIDQILLLESGDLPCCLESENLDMLGAALGAAPRATRALSFDRGDAGFWMEDERGRIMSVANRVGQPVPILDREVIQLCLAAKAAQSRPRFAMIETDLVGNISHHGVVTGLFLDGAERSGFQPVLGLNRRAKPAAGQDIDFWTGFSSYVYSPGTADDFTDELAAFIVAKRLGPDDVIFMHSLSPQIVLGAARYVAGHPDSSPRFAMRFFSTAEAMSGHKLSYTKILRSIESVDIVRRKMHFFCESENLISYYGEALGRRYPLLLNPEHPSLAIVRNSGWFDAGLGGRRHPTLAYFGEARAEKGFDFIPGILEELLADPAMDEFHFIIQTGSNSNNQTPEMAQAKSALSALKSAHPARIRLFESVETPEAFYFLMKHATAVIAPYRPDAYRVRGTGVTLEALQMGLEVFAWADTDLYATFRHTGRMIGVAKTESFGKAIARHYDQQHAGSDKDVEALRQSPQEVCRRLLSLCNRSGPARVVPPVLWVGNDTFGEGCSLVYTAQKRALRAIGCDYFELFVPWPDRHWQGVDRAVYDEKLYGFDSEYDCTGMAWVARPDFGAELNRLTDRVEKSGPTYALLRDLNAHMLVPDSLRSAIGASRVAHTILNYAHLYPVIADLAPQGQIVCETHDIMAYAHAVRRGGAVSLTEKIDEFSDLRHFPQIIAISADEQREMQSACPDSEVLWRLPPYIPEQPPQIRAIQPADVEEWPGRFPLPDIIAFPTPAMLSAYYARADLRQAFGLATPQGRAAFFRWWMFTDQLGPERRLELAPAQYDWLLGPADGRNAKTGLTGLLQLILSWRSDLRNAFAARGAVDVAGLTAWAEQHGTRELGFSREDLVTANGRHSGRSMATAPDINGALRAVIEAEPLDIRGTPAELAALFQRITEIGTIDLALIGSGHPANVTSFLWFINRVFLPYLAPQGRHLFIVGSVCRELASATHRNIVLLGRTERIEPVLRASRACPLPVIAGSGSPIKTIPAMAVNGAITATERIEQSFQLSAYGIPSFSDPKSFADDLNALLVDEEHREDRIQRTRKYVSDALTMAGYTEFWRERIGAPQAIFQPVLAEPREQAAGDARAQDRTPPPKTAAVLPINTKTKKKLRKH